jgi:hypothetical protein
MKVTLFDERGVELTRITARIGRSPDQMLVDWAARPDALFEYYFDRSSRAVTAVDGETTWSAVLGTLWQMGARRWFIHDIVRIKDRASSVEQQSASMNSLRNSNRDRRSDTGRTPTSLDATTAASDRDQRGSA